ncbi:MAG: hypothetical protein HRK26_02520 [Rickettsiaceae bacterium H1]|nr:hypothetical protein [Rickettsiaceae bacterium H1]
MSEHDKILSSIVVIFPLMQRSEDVLFTDLRFSGNNNNIVEFYLIIRKKIHGSFSV